MEGARWVQRVILERNPSTELRVYAIWFNMYPGDSRSKWDDSLMRDPRVTYLWDENKTVGRRLAAHKLVDDRGEILWDAFLLFGPDAVWDEAPSPLIIAGAPVYLKAHILADALLKLWSSD